VQLLAWRYSISLLDDAATATQLIQEAIAVAERAGDLTRLTYARWASAELYAARGDLAGQRRVLEAARAQMISTGTNYWLVPCLVDLADNALERGDRSEADRLAKDALLVSEAGVSAINRFRSLEIASRVRLAAGDIGEAGRYADAATVLARDIGEPWASARAALASAAYRRTSGDLDGGARILDAALKDAEQEARPTMRGVVTELRAMLATLRAERGDRAGAAALLAAARTDAPRADARTRKQLAAATRALEDSAAQGTVRA
jgi:MalT-like TPR region